MELEIDNINKRQQLIVTEDINAKVGMGEQDEIEGT